MQGVASETMRMQDNANARHKQAQKSKTTSELTTLVLKRANNPLLCYDSWFLSFIT